MFEVNIVKAFVSLLFISHQKRKWFFTHFIKHIFHDDCVTHYENLLLSLR